MTARPPAGFRYQQRLGVGFFGEIFRALGADGKEVRITHVDAELAATPGFASALARHGQTLDRLDHHNVLATHLVGKIPSGVFVVVTDALPGPVTLAEVLSDAAAAGRAVPAGVAWAIGRAVAAALAHAHSCGVIHGGVHPRSVVLDQHGGVKLADFGVARALTGVAARAEQPRLYQGYRGYLAPELALGEEPGSRADVYATGALLQVLLGGAPPPAPFSAAREVQAFLRRAVATEVEARFRDAGELAAALAQLPGGTAASGEQIAAWVADLPGAVDANLDAETEDVLSSIANDTFPREETTAPIEIGDALLDAATSDLLAELGTVAEPPHAAQAHAAHAAHAAPPPTPPPPPASPPARPSNDTGLARALSALEHESDDDRARTDSTGVDAPTRGHANRASTLEVDDDQVTHVDNSLAAADPLADLVATVTAGTSPDLPAMPTASGRKPPRRTSNDDTPLPPPAAHHDVEGTITRTGQEIVAGVRKLPPLPQARGGNNATAMDLLDPRAADTIPTPPVEPPRRRMRMPSLSADLDPPALRSGGSKIWFVTTILTVIALLAFLNFKTDLFHPARARAKEAAEKARYEAERRKAEAAIPKSGTVSIDSTPGEAAVWLLIGRTPVDSIPLQSGAVHQIRVEHEGFAARDLEVTSSQWSGAAGSMRAALDVKLEAAKPGAVAPAFPPEPRGIAISQSTRGVIHIESTPPGAQAWLLVGFTPAVDLAGVLAGAAYEFKITKDGFAPGFVVIRPEQWQDSEGKVLTQVSGSADLVAVTPPPRGRP